MLLTRNTKAYAPEHLSDEALSWVIRLNSGSASGADRDAYREWRQISDDHALAAAEAELLWSYGDGIDRNPATGLIQPVRRTPRVTRRGVLSGFVSATIAAPLGYWGYREVQRSVADYATRLAQTRPILMPDGSRGVLNALSRVDLAYAGGQRGVTIREGQLFVDLLSDASKPFVATMRSAEVTANAAAFDINGNMPADAVAIAVTKGSVIVRSQTGGGDVELAEGMRIDIDADGRIGIPEPQAASTTLAWQEGLLIAENRRLDEVVSAFRPYYPGWIVIRDERLAALRVNAVLELQNPNETLHTLASGLPIRVQEMSNYFIAIS